MPKTKKTQKLPASVSSDSPRMLELHDSPSPILELYERPEFRLAWDNDLPFHFARAVGELRRFRALTQAELAERAAMTQSQIARIEGADQNLTLKTCARLVEALAGRARFTIEPAEFDVPRLQPWQEWVKQGYAGVRPAHWQQRLVFMYEPIPGLPTEAAAHWTLEGAPGHTSKAMTFVTSSQAQISAGPPALGTSASVFPQGQLKAASTS